MNSQLTVQLVDVEDIDVGHRLRAHLGDDYVQELADSIRDVGLVNPITVLVKGDRFQLVAGLHRLEACRGLGWSDIPAIVRTTEELNADLAEIDENLIRRGLSLLEESEHLDRRDKILTATKRRAQSGGQRLRDDIGGASVAPPMTTAAIASQMGLSERTAQERMQIARGLPEEIRDLLRGTKLADQRYTLIDLARVEGVDDQRRIIPVLLDGKTGNVYDALCMVNPAFSHCPVCRRVVKGDVVHCRDCFSHRAGTETTCGECGGRLVHPKPRPAVKMPKPSSTGSSSVRPATPSPATAESDRSGGPIDYAVQDDDDGFVCAECGAEVTAPNLWHCSACGEHWTPKEDVCGDCAAPRPHSSTDASMPAEDAVLTATSAGAHGEPLRAGGLAGSKSEAAMETFLLEVGEICAEWLITYCARDSAKPPHSIGLPAAADVARRLKNPRPAAAAWRCYAEWVAEVRDALEARASKARAKGAA